jgi:hypothetical protein
MKWVLKRNPKNPFQQEEPRNRSGYSETFDSESRLRRIKEFGIDQLRAVLTEVPDLQKSVRLAAERRLRKLERESK